MIDKRIKEIMDAFEMGAIDNEQACGGLLTVMKDHGSEMKKYGALSMAKLVKDLRDQQKRYFTTKSKEALKESKKLEKQIDNVVETIIKVQKS